MLTLEFFRGRNGRRYDYSMSVSGTSLCFSIELSEPIFDFSFFLLFERCFIWKMPYETKYIICIKNIMKNHMILRRFSDKIALRNEKKWQIKNRLRQFFRETYESAGNTNGIFISSIVSSREANQAYHIFPDSVIYSGAKSLNINGFQLCTVGGVEVTGRRVTGRRDNANRLTRGLLLSHVVSEGFRDIRDTTTFCSRRCELPCMIKSGVAQFQDFSLVLRHFLTWKPMKSW